MYFIRLLHGIQPLVHGVVLRAPQMVSEVSREKTRKRNGFIADPDPNRQFSKIEKDSLFHDGKLHPSITVIGKKIYDEKVKHS